MRLVGLIFSTLLAGSVFAAQVSNDASDDQVQSVNESILAMSLEDADAVDAVDLAESQGPVQLKISEDDIIIVDRAQSLGNISGDPSDYLLPNVVRLFHDFVVKNLRSSPQISMIDFAGAAEIILGSAGHRILEFAADMVSSTQPRQDFVLGVERHLDLIIEDLNLSPQVYHIFSRNSILELKESLECLADDFFAYQEDKSAAGVSLTLTAFSKQIQQLHYYFLTTSLTQLQQNLKVFVYGEEELVQIAQSNKSDVQSFLASSSGLFRQLLPKMTGLEIPLIMACITLFKFFIDLLRTISESPATARIIRKFSEGISKLMKWIRNKILDFKTVGDGDESKEAASAAAPREQFTDEQLEGLLLAEFETLEHELVSTHIDMQKSITSTVRQLFARVKMPAFLKSFIQIVRSEFGAVLRQTVKNILAAADQILVSSGEALKYFMASLSMAQRTVTELYQVVGTYPAMDSHQKALMFSKSLVPFKAEEDFTVVIVPQKTLPDPIKILISFLKRTLEFLRRGFQSFETGIMAALDGLREAWGSLQKVAGPTVITVVQTILNALKVNGALRQLIIDGIENGNLEAALTRGIEMVFAAIGAAACDGGITAAILSTIDVKYFVHIIMRFLGLAARDNSVEEALDKLESLAQPILESLEPHEQVNVLGFLASSDDKFTPGMALSGLLPEAGRFLLQDSQDFNWPEVNLGALLAGNL